MLSLKNQFIFAPIKTGYSDKNGVVTKKHLDFYKRRSRYLGGIIFEPFYLERGLRELPTQMGIDDEDKIEGLKKRGHEIDLYEKNTLGGQFNLAPLTPHKRSMSRLIPYFAEELNYNKVNIIFKEAVKSDIISGYDCVILATGSRPTVPSIPGLNKFYWADILLEENLPRNKKVLIIGGGLIGVDIATALIPRNNKVIIVKRTTDFGEDMEMQREWGMPRMPLEMPMKQ
jgi:hypothetical protein